MITLIITGVGFLYTQMTGISKRLDKKTDEQQVKEMIAEDRNIRNIRYTLKGYAQNPKDLESILRHHQVI